MGLNAPLIAVLCGLMVLVVVIAMVDTLKVSSVADLRGLPQRVRDVLAKRYRPGDEDRPDN